MRLTAAEKHEIIRLVEGSDLSVRRTLRELGVHRSTFYAWYRRYQAVGAAGLVPRPSAARRHWNRIPLRVRHRVVEAALADPVKSPRELAWQFTDRERHFLSESSVYRILKAEDLITSPAYVVLSAAKHLLIRRTGPTSCGKPTSPTCRLSGGAGTTCRPCSTITRATSWRGRFGRRCRRRT